MNLFDLITKSGYEIQTIGNDTLPCTIMQKGEPTAILMPDLSLRMVSGQEKAQPELTSMIQFSLDNQGMEHFQDEFKLSQYKNVYLTTTYDLENHKPVFNVYQLNGKSLNMLFSSDQQEKAAAEYAQRSGLVQADVLKEQQQAKESRLQNFLRQLQTHGFHVQKSKEKEHHYEITDKNGKSVGFIGSDNRAVITSDDFYVRRRLTDLYPQRNEPVATQPPHFSQWQQLLHNLGYSLRMFFNRSGAQMDVQNAQHQTVAAINKADTIEYTDQAAPAEREQLSSAQEQIYNDLQAGMEQQANVSRQTNVSHEAEEQQIFKEQQAEQEQEHRQEQHQEFKEESRENEASADGIFLTAAEVQALSALLYENHDILAHIDPSLIDKLRQPEIPKEDDKPLNYQEQLIQSDFQKAYHVLQTIQGFESPDAANLQKNMIQTYGTASLQEFQQKLKHGDYAEQPSLAQQLHSAKREANQINSRVQPQQEHAKERS